MRKILLILALLSSAFVAAQERPFQAFFGIKTDNPLAVVSALDSFSNANCPGTSSVRLCRSYLMDQMNYSYNHCYFSK